MCMNAGSGSRRAFRLWTAAISGAVLVLGLWGHGPGFALAKAVEPPPGFLAYEVRGARLLIKAQTDCSTGSVFAVMGDASGHR